MRTITISIFALLGLIATPAFAQFDSNSFIDLELTIDLEPEYPRPGEEVTASLNDYSGGNYGSTITWVLDDEEIPEAKNQRNTVLTAGEPGVTQTIKVVLTKPSGSKEVVTSSIRPVYLDMVIEAQTRVPDFYLGRSVPSIGSQVNATALIRDVRFGTEDLVYTWQLNKKVLEGGPIRGINSVSFEMPRGNSAILSLVVTSLRGTTIAKRAILVPSVKPTIYFYEVDILYGVSKKIINETIPFIGNSLTVRAEPYNLDTRVYNKPDIKEWEINNVSTENTGGNPYEATMQKTFGSNGVSSLNFHVRDTRQILQGAEADIRINF